MSNHSSSPAESPAASDETIRNQLLRFLRLVAKDVVHRIVIAKSEAQPPSGDAELSQQKPSEH